MKRRVTHDNLVTENISLIENGLLGEYDARGQYFIATEITNELINLPKKKKNSFNNSMFCVSKDHDHGEMVFELAFQDKRTDGEVAIASLYILETVNKINGYLQNTIKTKLGDFRSNTGNFIEESYKFFNIKSVEDDDAGMDNEEAEESLKRNFINSKRKLRTIIKKLSKDKYLDAYGKYFAERMSVLTKLDNEFSSAVLDSFNSHYNMIENDFLVSNKDYKMLNELLDKSIDEFSGTNELFNTQEQEFNMLTSKHKNTFINTVNQQLNNDKNKALSMLDKKEKESIQSVIATEREHFDQVNKEIQELKKKENTQPQIDKQTIIKEVQESTQKSSQVRENQEKVNKSPIQEPQAKDSQPKEIQVVTKEPQIKETQMVTKEPQVKETQIVTKETQPVVRETQVVRENVPINVNPTPRESTPIMDNHNISQTPQTRQPREDFFNAQKPSPSNNVQTRVNPVIGGGQQPRKPGVQPQQSSNGGKSVNTTKTIADNLAKLRATRHSNDFEHERSGM